MPLLFVHTLNEAMAAAALMGLLGGMASAAYLDLIIRSCPPALEGATVMMAGSLYFVSTRLGDVLGAYIYEKFGGFLVCVSLMTALYLSIFLVLPFARANASPHMP